MAYTADDLVTAVRRRARLPDGALTAAEIMSIADEEMSTMLIPLVRRHREDYWVKSEDTTFVADQSDYRIPSRAQGGSLREVTVLDSNSNEFNVPYIPLADHYRYVNGSSLWWPSGIAFTIQGDLVRILPTPNNANNTLRLYYYLRPGLLVTSTEVGTITSIDTGTKTITCSGGIPSAWTTSNTFDLIQAKPNFDALAIDQTATTVDTGADTVTFTNALPSDLAVGDIVSLATESHIVQLPAELHPVLYSAVVVRVLETVGDEGGMAAAQAKLEREMGHVGLILEPRVDGETPKAINWASPLRFGRRWR